MIPKTPEVALVAAQTYLYTHGQVQETQGNICIGQHYKV
jgi:hypothetical protein